MLKTFKLTKQRDQVTLWGTSLSPYVRKVMITLAEKNIAYDHQEILPKSLLLATNQPIPKEFDQASPLGKIPAIKINDIVLADSSVIAQYIDRQYTSGTQLYPKQSAAFAKTLWFEQYANHELTQVIYKQIFIESVIKPNVLNAQPDQNIIDMAIQHNLPPILNYLTESLRLTDSWISGKQFSMADIAIATHLLALNMSGYDLAQQGWSVLNRYLNMIMSRPSFQTFKSIISP